LPAMLSNGIVLWMRGVLREEREGASVGRRSVGADRDGSELSWREAVGHR